MSYRARITWQRDPAYLGRALSQFGERVNTHALTQHLERQAPRIQEQMQADAPWKDRTGAARRALRATVETSGREVELALSHGVEYGKFLELSNGGRYAIIGPTVIRLGPEIMRGLKGLADRPAGGGGWQAW